MGYSARAYVVLAVSLLVSLGGFGFARFSYSVLVPFMISNLDLSYTEAGIPQSALLIGYFVGSLTISWVYWNLNEKALVIMASLVTAIGLGWTGMSSNEWQLIASRFVTGIGCAYSYIPLVGIVTSWFDARHRGRIMGTVVGASGLAVILSGLFPIAISNYGWNWRWCWYVQSLFLIFVAVACTLVKRHHVVSDSRRDTVATDAGKYPVNPQNGPVSWKDIRLIKLYLPYFFFGLAYVSYTTFFVQTVIHEIGYSSELAGLTWSMAGTLGIFSGLVWGLISDRLGRIKALASALTTMALAISAVAIPTSFAPILSAALYGICSLAVPTVMAAICADWFGTNQSSKAMGIMTSVLGVGQLLAPTFSGWVAQLVGSFKVSYILFGGVCFLAAMLSLSAKRIDKMIRFETLQG